MVCFVQDMSQFSLNKDSIIFLDQIDKINGYSTIAYDWGNDDIFKISRDGYFLLKSIQKNNPISQSDETLIEEFKKRGIIIETSRMSFVR